MTAKIKIVCRDCGSEDVTRDADVRWCKETQEWDLGAVFDNADCDHCGQTKLEEIALTEDELKEIAS